MRRSPGGSYLRTALLMLLLSAYSCEIDDALSTPAPLSGRPLQSEMEEKAEAALQKLQDEGDYDLRGTAVNRLGRMIDASGYFTEEEDISGEEKILVTEKMTNTQINIIFKDNLGDIFSGTLDIFDHLGLGVDHVDNGILITFDILNRKIRIMTGNGVEGPLTDVEAKRILEDKEVKNNLRSGNYMAAVDLILAGITNAITMDEAAELAEDLEQNAPSPINGWKVLACLLSISLAAFAGIWTKASKDAFNENVALFNGVLNKIEETVKQGSVDLITAKELLSKAQMIETDKFLWAQEELHKGISELIEKTATVGNTFTVGKKTTAFSSSWSSFLKTIFVKSGLTQEALDEIQHTLQRKKKIAGPLHDKLSYLQMIFDFFQFATSAQLEKYLTHHKKLTDEVSAIITPLKQADFVFPHIEKELTDVVAVITEKEKTMQEAENLTKRLEAKTVVDEQVPLMEEKKTLLSTMHTSFSSHHETIDSYALDENTWSSLSQKHTDLIFGLIDDEDITEDEKKSLCLDRDFSDVYAEYLEFWQLYHESYSLKDIEASYEEYNKLTNVFDEIGTIERERKEYIANQQKAKEAVPGALKKCESAWNSKGHIHSSYSGEKQRIKTELDRLKRLAPQEKNHWAQLHTNLSTLLTDIRSLISDSDRQKRQDEQDARDAAEAARSSSSSSSDRGGSTGGGGAGSSW